MGTAWGARSELFRPGFDQAVIRRRMTLREAVDAFLLLPESEQRRCSINILDEEAVKRIGVTPGALGILMFHAIHRIASASPPDRE